MRKLYKILPLIGLFSCSVGPDYQQPQFWPEKEIADKMSSENQNNIYWYKAFNDEILNRLISEALSSSPNVKIAIAKLRQARYSFNIKQVEYLPIFDVDGNYNYEYAPQYGEGGDKDSYFRAGFDMSWELDIWGGGRRQNESYKALYKSASENLADVWLTVTAEIADNYVELRTTQQQQRIAKENLRLQKEILTTVRQKYASGLASEADYQQAEYAVRTTQALIPDLQTQENGFVVALAVLSGQLPDNLQKLRSSISTISYKPDIKNFNDIPLAEIRNRPDVKAAEDMLIAKNAAIGQAVADLFPNVSISALVGWQGHLVHNLIDSKNAAYSYAPTINLPFLHWGALINQVKLSKAVKEEYLYTYQNTLLTAVGEVNNALEALQKGYSKSNDLQLAAINMQKALQLMKNKYEQGLIPFSDLLTAEQNLLTAQNNWVVSQGQNYRNVIGFYKSIGGGYCNTRLRK